MGIIRISDSQGNVLEQTYFGADVQSFGYDSTADIRLDEYQNDGYILDLEIADARVQLEKVINKHTIGSGGPLGLGGYGGKEELFLQAWRLKGASKEETPDGFSMPVTVHLEEEYRGPGIIFHDMEKVTRDVPMTIRWEAGKVRLYQCTPPAYTPATPSPATPPPAETPAPTLNRDALASLETFFSGYISVASTFFLSLIA